MNKLQSISPRLWYARAGLIWIPRMNGSFFIRNRKSEWMSRKWVISRNRKFGSCQFFSKGIADLLTLLITDTFFNLLLNWTEKLRTRIDQLENIHLSKKLLFPQLGLESFVWTLNVPRSLSSSNVTMPSHIDHFLYHEIPQPKSSISGFDFR